MLTNELEEIGGQLLMVRNPLRKVVQPGYRRELQQTNGERYSYRTVVAVHDPGNIIAWARGQENRRHCRDHEQQHDNFGKALHRYHPIS